MAFYKLIEQIKERWKVLGIRFKLFLGNKVDFFSKFWLFCFIYNN